MIYGITSTASFLRRRAPGPPADIDHGAADGPQRSRRERQTCNSLISSPLQRISRFLFIPYYLIILLSVLNWESCGQGATHDASRSTEAINPMNTDFSSSCYSECVSRRPFLPTSDLVLRLELRVEVRGRRVFTSLKVLTNIVSQIGPHSYPQSAR